MRKALRTLLRDPDYRVELHIVLALMTGLCLTFVIQLFSEISIKHLLASEETVLKNFALDNDIEDLNRNLITLESSLRSYVISGNQQLIRDLSADIVGARLKVGDIYERVGDNSAHVAELQHLRRFVDAKVAFSESVLDTFHLRGQSAAIAMINTREGLMLRDSIVEITRVLREEEQSRIANTIASNRREAQSVRRVDYLSSILAALIIPLAIAYLIRATYKRSVIQRRLEEARTLAETSVQLKEQFMANMSHEIRTPLNAIIGFTQLLQRTPTDDRQREFIDNIQHSGENLLHIVNDILDFSKIEAGQLRLEQIPFHLPALLQSLETMFRPQAEAKGLKLTILAPDTGPDTLIGDPTRLTQILINLLGNALKFTENGAITLTAAFAEAEADTVQLEIGIADTGVGIPADLHESIFHRFKQGAADSTRRFGGTGLGLSIVRSLVEAQGGSIRLDSEPGRGTTFYLRIPYQILRQEVAPAPRKHTEIAPYAALPAGHILLAEDNLLNRRIVETWLDEWALTYHAVDNGREAVDEALTGAYDLLLLDIQMPEMDGYSAAQAIRTGGADLPIIALTAHALPAERDRCLRLGMNDYLAKPLAPERLHQLLHHYLQQGKSDQTIRIDQAYLQTITQGKAARLKEMVDIFLAQTSQEFALLEKAWATADFTELSRVAHGMRSTVGYMGLQSSLGELLARIETVAQSTPPPSDQLRELLDQLDDQLSRARSAVGELLT